MANTIKQTGNEYTARIPVTVIRNPGLRRVLRYFKSLLLLELVRGLLATGRHLWQPKVTVQYPEEKSPQSPRFRGLHALRRYANGEERCIACKLCEVSCPAVCITIDSDERADGTRRTSRYEIDLFKCIYCGYCEEACPVDAIVLTRTYEFSYEDRSHQVINKEELLELGDLNEANISADRALDAPYR